MDKKKAFDSSTQWISDEQRIHETSDYGRNQRAVNDALAEQQRRVKLVNEYSKDVEKATVAAKSTSEKDRISEEYEELKEVAQHRENCLKDIAQIASLEDIFNTLSIEFANRASSLVVDACSEARAVSSPSACGIGGASGGTHGSSDGIARAAQSCILAVRNNWNWISKLVKCSDVHLKHVSDYHQFFHEAKEYGQWMPAELNKHVRTLEKMKPEEDDEAALLKSLKEILAVFLHWQNKINILFDKSRKIVPVHQRTKPLDHYVPVTSLCDYKTNEITIQEGEELTLLDNSKPQIWLVRNMHSTESRVPSVICVIPGPDTEAVAVAMRLRLHLLKTWTVCVRNIGHVVILYFGLVLKDWDEDSRKKLQSMTDDDKMRTLQVLQWILDIFSKYWKDDAHFRDLFLRIENTRTIVRGNGNPSDYDSSFSREYITRVKIMEELLTHFRNYLKQWETYKLLAEASRQSDYMLLMQNWEELNFFSTEEVLRKVSLDMEISSEQTDTTDNVQEVTENTIVEQTTTLVTCQQEDETQLQEETITLQEETTTQEEETRTSFQTVEQHAEAEQYLHAEQEERKKFVITGVIDPRNGEEVSMDQAILLGIINQKAGTYVNTVTNTAIPIPEAMNAGKIKVEFTTVRRTEEKRSDVGLITISTERESRPYTVKAVVDAATDEELTIDQAIERGILDQKSGTLRNTLTNTIMTLGDAMDSGHLIVEFDSDAPAGEVQNVTIVYAIHAVVDQKEKCKITFSDAVKRGLIDKSTGAYYHNVDGKNVYVGDAIKRGFIKATVVKDPASMDISPENKMVVEKVDLIRKKLINPLKTIAAMRGAVTEHKQETEVKNSGQAAQGNGVKNEDGRGTELDSGSSMDDITHLSPRLPGDGIEYGGEDTRVTDLSKSKLPVKSSEEYLDQSLIQRMSSTEKQSRLHQMKEIFQQKHIVKQTDTNHTEYPVEGKTIPKSPRSPQSPKKISKIPRFSSSETINISEEKISKRGASKIPTPMFRSKSVSMDHLNASPSEEAARIPMFRGVSTSDRSVSNSHHQSEEILSLSHSQLGYDREARNSPMSYRKKDGTSVLIYTEETESLIGVPTMAEVIKPEMCTVGTQYEASSEDQTQLVNAGSGNGSAIAGGEHLLFGCQESTKETVLITSEKHTKTDTNTLITTEKETVKSQSGATKGAEERFGFKGIMSTKNITETNAGKDTTDLEVSGKQAEDMRLRYRGKRKGKGKKNRIPVGQSDNPRGTQDGSSEEEMFYLAQEAKGLHVQGKSEAGIYGSGLLWSESAIQRDTAMGMVQRITETTSTQTEQLELLQGAIAAIMADPDIDDSSKGRSALCLRICKACLPLQMLMLLLLGLACLFPMSEEEYSCTLSNNFENSLAMMLRHRDGPPPV